MPSICAGDSGGAGQHLPQCMVDEPETLWRYDPHGLCAAAYRSSLASYRARSLGFRLMVPQNSQGSASWYTRARRRGLVHLVRQRCDKRTASRSRSRSRWARSCLAATANGEPRSPRRSYSAVSGTRPTVPGQLHRLAAEQVLSRSARHGEACGQCASPPRTQSYPMATRAGAIVGPLGSVRFAEASVQSARRRRSPSTRPATWRRLLRRCSARRRRRVGADRTRDAWRAGPGARPRGRGCCAPRPAVGPRHCCDHDGSGIQRDR